ncbi:MAG: hypothetical protein IJ218_00675 [Alphaproteobacteria bacterium]|nr:hypothetical protein [Alphaproteobacteria bacterium]
MAQDKKTEEREYLEYFLASDEGKKWYEKNKIISCQESEHPDFIFMTEDNQKIGLEITQFIVRSKHGRALRHLMNIGNKACKYAKKRHDLNISILIDKFDKRQWCAKTPQEMMEAAYNPGFWDIYNQKAFKSGIEDIIDRNIENLKQWPCFVKESINVQDEYFNISITAFPDMEGKFDCAVNNECYSKENPFDELQEKINKKNEKFDSYLKKCDKCYLLIYLPDVSKGNYCYFTGLLKKHIFHSKFEATYLCKWNTIFTKDNFALELKSHS